MLLLKNLTLSMIFLVEAQLSVNVRVYCNKIAMIMGGQQRCF